MSLEVDLDTTVTEAGQHVTGRVHLSLSPEKLERATALHVYLVMKVRGSGTPESRDGDATSFDGPFEAGVPVEFALTLPESGPISFDGRHVKIDWFVCARLEVPWGIDPTGEFVVRVGPRRERPRVPELFEVG